MCRFFGPHTRIRAQTTNHQDWIEAINQLVLMGKAVGKSAAVGEFSSLGWSSSLVVEKFLCVTSDGRYTRLSD